MRKNDFKDIISPHVQAMSLMNQYPIIILENFMSWKVQWVKGNGPMHHNRIRNWYSGYGDELERGHSEEE